MVRSKPSRRVGRCVGPWLRDVTPSRHPTLSCSPQHHHTVTPSHAVTHHLVPLELKLVLLMMLLLTLLLLLVLVVRVVLLLVPLKLELMPPPLPLLLLQRLPLAPQGA